MLVEVIGDGSGEQEYGGRMVKIDDSVSQQEVYAWGDKIRDAAEDEYKDKFGDIDPEKMSLEELVKRMPESWHAEVTDYVCGAIFV